MALTMQRLVDEYYNKPDPANRGFWYDAEIASRENVPVQDVTRIRGFYQTEMNKPGATQEGVIKLWNSKNAPAVTPPVAKPSGQEKKLGDLTLTEAKAFFREIGVAR